MKLRLDADRLEGWTVAVRPHTLPASAAPVLVGSGFAVREGVFHLPTAAMALLGALILQVTINLANDYFDHEKGVDTEDRVGFRRACNAGLLSPEEVLTGIALAMTVALVPGGYLVSQGGLPLFLTGLACLIAVLGYSGGPVPYGSYALGDAMVFLFFGVVAVAGTYYVQFCATVLDGVPLGLPPDSLPSSVLLGTLPSGALATAILIINNLRDRPQDKRADKHTMAVLIGRAGSLVEFLLLLILAYVVPVLLVFLTSSTAVLLPLLTLPLAGDITRKLLVDPEPEVYNDQLTRTGRLLFVHNLFFTIGLIL